MRRLGLGFARVALVVVGLLGAELLARAGLALAGTAYDGDAVRASWSARARSRVAARDRTEIDAARADEAVRAFVGGDHAPHPYVGFAARQDAEELHQQLAILEADDGSLAEAFTVLVVGGSVAEYFADPVNGGLAPLRETLEADPEIAGRALLFLDHGRAAYKQPQQLLWVSWLFTLGFEPDLVINVDGLNEVVLPALNAEQGAHPLFPTWLHWAAVTADAAQVDAALAAKAVSRELARRALDLGLERSALTGAAVEAILASYDRRRAREESELAAADGRDATKGPPWSGDPAAAVERSVRAWERASRALHDLCRTRGVRYLHVLQPTLWDDGAKPITEDERANGAFPETAIDAIRHGYPLLRDAGRRLAADGVPFVDASRIFEHETRTLYFDACHFVRPGTELLGSAVADAL